mgnify:FL=1|tara:strand:+ start:1244 stop:1801 length:558 start_codon:yes stop_codon:yes gene_type:complete
MKATEEQLKQIILEEVQKYLEEVEVAKKLQNIGNMSIDAFIEFVNTTSAVLQRAAGMTGESVPLVRVLEIYLEAAVDLQRSWSKERWHDFSAWDKNILLKLTYPTTPYHEAEALMLRSFWDPVVQEIITDDIVLAAELTKKSLEETEAGEYLGPEEEGGEPKSPHWREYLEEIVKEEIINHLKEK